MNVLTTQFWVYLRSLGIWSMSSKSNKKVVTSVNLSDATRNYCLLAQTRAP